jgi:transcriptional regulator with XRE-family HTH domain
MSGSTTVPKSRGDLLRQYRRDKGLSQREAATEIGVSSGTLGRAEAGHGLPQPKVAKRITDFYGVRPSKIWPIVPSEEAIR